MKPLTLLVLALASLVTLFGSLDARAVWQSDPASSFDVPVLLPSGGGDGGRDDDEEDEEERRLQPGFGGIRLVDPDVAAALN